MLKIVNKNLNKMHSIKNVKYVKKMLNVNIDTYTQGILC